MNKRIFIISLVLAISSLAGFAKKKGKYTAKIKNKKIAKIAKDSKKRQYIYAKKAGKTKAKIYEKLKNHKKRYIGKITIKVKKEDMGDCAGQMMSDDNYKAFNNIFIKSAYERSISKELETNK